MLASHHHQGIFAETTSPAVLQHQIISLAFMSISFSQSKMCLPFFHDFHSSNFFPFSSLLLTCLAQAAYQTIFWIKDHALSTRNSSSTVIITPSPALLLVFNLSTE